MISSVVKKVQSSTLLNILPIVRSCQAAALLQACRAGLVSLLAVAALILCTPASVHVMHVYRVQTQMHICTGVHAHTCTRKQYRSICAWRSDVDCPCADVDRGVAASVFAGGSPMSKSGGSSMSMSDSWVDWLSTSSKFEARFLFMPGDR